MTERTIYLGIDASRGKAGADAWEVAVAKVRRESAEAARTVKVLDESMDRAADAAKDAAAKVTGGLVPVLDRVDEGAKKTTKSVGELSRETLTLAEAHKQTADRINLSLAAVSAAIGLAVRRAANDIAAFDGVLAKLRASSGASTEELVELERAALEIGSRTGGPTAAASTLLELTKAGFSAREAIAALPTALSLARAGDLQFAESADVVVKTLAQYNLAVDQSARVADVLVSASDATRASVQSLAAGLSVVGPVAATANISLEETVAALEALAQKGQDGSKAGTGLSAVIASLEKPTPDATAALERLGVAQDKVRVSSVGLVSALSQLKQANTSDLFSIFGRESASEGSALIASTEAMKGFGAELANVSGAAAAKAAEIDNSLTGSFERVRRSIESMALAAGRGGLGTAMREISDFAGDVVFAMTGVDTNFRTSETAARGFAATLGAIGISAFVYQTTKGIEAIGAFATRMLAFTVIGDGYTSTIVRARGATVAFQGAMATLSGLAATNPIGLMVVGLGVLTAAVGTFGRDTVTATAAVTEHEAALKRLGSTIDRLWTSRAAASRANSLGDSGELRGALDEQRRALVAESIRLRRTGESVGYGDLQNLVPGFGLGLPDFNALQRSPSGNPLVGNSLAIATVETEIARLKSESEKIAPPTQVSTAAIALADKQVEKIDAVIAALRREREELSLSQAEIAASNAIRQAGIDIYGPLTEQQAEAVATIDREARATVAAKEAAREAAAAKKEQQEAYQDHIKAVLDSAVAEAAAQRAAEESMRAYQSETEMLRLSERQRFVLSEVTQRETEARRAGIALTEEEIAAWRRLAEERFDAAEAIRQDGEALDQWLRVAESRSSQRTSARDAIAALNADSDYALSTGLGGSAVTRNREADVFRSRRSFEASLSDLPVEEATALADEFERAYRLKQLLDAQAANAQLLEDLQQERELLGLTNDEREIATALQNQMRATQGQVTDEMRNTLEEQIRINQRLRDSHELAFGVGESIAGGLKAATIEFESFGSAAESVLTRVSGLAADVFFFNPLAQSLGSGLFGAFGSVTTNANGNVFGRNGIEYFADGDVFSSPTLFGFGNGRLGVMGEAGPEVIMPIERGPDGRLGVAAYGSGGGGVTIYQTINLGGGDVYGGVHRSTRQAMQAARSAVEA